MAPGTVRPDELWFVAQSHLRLGHRDEATMQFSMLRDTAGPGAFAAAVEIALALMNGSAETIDSARNAAAAFPTDPYVQYELGVAHAARNDFPAAARAFDTCADAAPRFAYAYYQAGLMYDRLNRADLTVARFESFLRVAPQAPERPQVESILQTVRR
jgi:tetratricopeptide (TPR) repeat protein